jgi:hypothetical protein
MGVDGNIVAFPAYVRGRDDGEVIEYPTLAAMQHHLEAIDVENEEYEAWDAQGSRLQLAVRNPKSECLNIIPTQDKLSKEKFAELRSESQEWPRYIPISQRFAHWIKARVKGPSAKG